MTTNLQLHAEVAYKVFGDAEHINNIKKLDKESFFKIDKQKFDLIKKHADQAFLRAYWIKEAAKLNSKNPDQARQEYFIKNVKISRSEIDRTISEFKDKAPLAGKSKTEQENLVRNFLRGQQEERLEAEIIEKALSSKTLIYGMEEPSAPLHEVTITKDDHVRYGPRDSDVKPISCKGDDCAITIVEYSEFQCVFCARVQPTVRRLLSEYKGKIRYVVRDFPLSFHPRAKPAAIAAKCAAFQSEEKYWKMYTKLFDNQRNLNDSDFYNYAEQIKLNPKKFKECYQNPVKATKLVDENFRVGSRDGVTGTPAFFINGVRLSGALPFDEFKNIIDKQLKKKSS